MMYLVVKACSGSTRRDISRPRMQEWFVGGELASIHPQDWQTKALWRCENTTARCLYPSPISTATPNGQITKADQGEGAPCNHPAMPLYCRRGMLPGSPF